MRQYHQLTSEERYALSAFRKQGYSIRGIAAALGRAPSTISREIRRNIKPDGGYRANVAGEKTRGRRRRSRRNRKFEGAEWRLVVWCLEKKWSPEQIAGRLRFLGVLWISHETIYRYVWDDKHAGGALHTHLRQSSKQRRKRRNSKDSRGRMRGKRSINERPPGAENRSRIGHFEGDTMMGSSDDLHCLLTMVDRKSGFSLIGKLKSRTVADTNRKFKELVQRSERRVRTITLDHGTEFHGFMELEADTGARVYFANPYHSWERGTSENTNGLIRQYFPKRQSLAQITQEECDWVANELNNRPRKRLGWRTPKECHVHN